MRNSWKWKISEETLLKQRITLLNVHFRKCFPVTYKNLLVSMFIFLILFWRFLELWIYNSLYTHLFNVSSVFGTFQDLFSINVNYRFWNKKTKTRRMIFLELHYTCVFSQQKHLSGIKAVHILSNFCSREKTCSHVFWCYHKKKNLVKFKR